ncbi:maltose/maltodextrin transporter ATP-binding protein [Actinobacillus equuli]|nr:maltose/maltodextrin transporter ATP-binding protein [Actinobacillus equuli]
MTDVRLVNVCKSYGNVHISKDVNLEIKDGEFVVLSARQAVVNQRYYE